MNPLCYESFDQSQREKTKIFSAGVFESAQIANGDGTYMLRPMEISTGDQLLIEPRENIENGRPKTHHAPRLVYVDKEGNDFVYRETSGLHTVGNDMLHGLLADIASQAWIVLTPSPSDHGHGTASH